MPKSMTGQVFSKSQFKPHALELFRRVQRTGKPLTITERGKPVLKVVPFRDDPQEGLRALRGSVLKYDRPTDPVALEDWESLR
jgi:prevent-host-death family protein